MTAIDATLGDRRRAAFVNEIRSTLPAYLGASSHEFVDATDDVAVLLQLTRGDLRRVIQRHVVLSEEMAAFTAGLRTYLRSPSTGSERPRVESRVVQGQVDWSATMRSRSSRGADVIFVTRPASRVFDIDENRAVRYVMYRLLTLSNETISDLAHSDSVSVPTPSWRSRVKHQHTALQLATRTQWLRSVMPSVALDVGIRRALARSRRQFIKGPTRDVSHLLARTLDTPSAGGIIELLSRRYFEPAQDWRLYELVVAVRVANAFRAVARRALRSRLLVGSRLGRYASFELHDGTKVDLWYQAWPTDSRSAHAEIVRRHHVESVGGRPDIVVVKRDDGGRVVDCVLLELKASENPRTIGDGVLQALGYIQDRARLLERHPSAWVVPIAGFVEAPASADHPVWITDCDKVADYLVTRFHGSGAVA